VDAIILAGGAGERLKSRVPDLPKPMAPIHNRPFLEFLMDYWIEQGIERFILAIGYKAKMIQNHFGNQYRNVDIVYSVEPDFLGTGGGLLLALKSNQVSAQVLVLNGDTFFEIERKSLETFHRSKQSALTICLHTVENNDRYGHVCTDAEGRVIQFLSPQTSQKGFINGGVYLFNQSFLTSLAKKPSAKLSLEQVLLPGWVQNHQAVFGFEAKGRFIDIGIPKDYEKAQQIF